jgi:hypothetical protein
MNIQANVCRLLLLLLVFASPSLASSNAEAAASTRRAVEVTFLKSNPGQREQLRTFIVANWFAMDTIAKEKGLILSFTVLDSGNDDGPWNLMVSTTYLDDKGYEGVAEAFESIRLAHKTVRVQGKTLEDLGAVVDSRKLFEVPALVTR